MLIFIAFLTSLLLSFSLIELFKHLFNDIWILDHPEKYWKKRKPVPYSMWVVFFVIFLICSFFFVEHNSKLYLLWIFWFVITLLSFIDDMIDVSPKIRLFFQILVWAVIWITSIKIWYISNIFGWLPVFPPAAWTCRTSAECRTGWHWTRRRSPMQSTPSCRKAVAASWCPQASGAPAPSACRATSNWMSTRMPS